MLYTDESASDQEQKVIEDIVENVIASREKHYKPNSVAERALHGKSNGVVNAVLKIGRLPVELQVGIFAEPAEFRAVMRFSNGALSSSTPDIVPNVRGVALKLFAVPGLKLLKGFEQTDEHDFIMANHESFFVKDIDDLLLLTERQIVKLVKNSPATLREILKATSKLVGSPLDIDYFSQIPHRFGDRACKFSLIHQKGKYDSHLSNFFERDYLRKEVNRHLHKHSAKFTMCVQFMQPGDSIADSTVAWTGPQVPLAELTIPSITDDIQETDGESLGFNPFCVVEAHEPLGWPSRLRKELYLADWQWRNSKNDSLKKASFAESL